MADQTASVGRIVHYVSYGTPGGEYTLQCRAAIVTATETGPEGNPDVLDLCVLNPTGQFFNHAVSRNDANTGGTWHWPERV
jgi:hypothetical protein